MSTLAKTNEPKTAGAKTAADVTSLLKARNALLWVVTREEARVERLLVQAAKDASYDVRFWDCSAGVTNFLNEEVAPGKQGADPSQTLAFVKDSTDRQVWILRDLPSWLRDPTVLRAVRNLARMLPQTEREKARAIIILSPDSQIPPELSGHAIAIDWPLPDRSEIAAILDTVLNALPDELKVTAAPNGKRDAAIDAAVGLIAVEAQSCYAKSLVQSRTIDPAIVAAEKRRVIAREKVLEWYDPAPGGLDAIGGLEGLKDWLRQRKSAFSAKARAYGLPAPKGCLLVGVPGTGKSLTAKAISAAWGLPLLKLDLGALKSKYVGESEGNIRRALRVAEAVAPCVLWLDEIEKALAGATQGAADGGVSSDALGAVLQWMQERQGQVFMIATSNDVSALPPELLRKGRFDEIFWVDLPTADERKAIVAAALRQYGRSADDIDIPAVAAVTDTFTGAEIAALVPDALYAAFADGERAIRTEDLIASAKVTVPLARTSGDRIERLRAWAKGKARPAAGAFSTTTNTTGAPALDI